MGGFLNLAIMREPWNWVTVTIMCLFALVLLNLLFPEAGTANNS